jgi:hypothetical protein
VLRIPPSSESNQGQDSGNWRLVLLLDVLAEPRLIRASGHFIHHQSELRHVQVAGELHSHGGSLEVLVVRAKQDDENI